MDSITGSSRLCHDCARTFTSLENRNLCPRCRPTTPDADDEPEPDTGYTGYYGPEWDTTRSEILERDDYCCQWDGCEITDKDHRDRDDLFPPGKGLHIHHITKASEFNSHDDANSADNLVSLCATHHRLAEHSGVD